MNWQTTTRTVPFVDCVYTVNDGIRYGKHLQRDRFTATLQNFYHRELRN